MMTITLDDLKHILHCQVVSHIETQLKPEQKTALASRFKVLSKPEGLNTSSSVFDYTLRNYRLTCTRDPDSTVSALFFRVFSKSEIKAYHIEKGTIKKLSICNGMTKETQITLPSKIDTSGLISIISSTASFATSLLTNTDLQEFMGDFCDALSNDHPVTQPKVTCEVESLENVEKIQNFFKDFKDMLPAPIYGKVYPYNWLHVGAALLLLIGVSYAAYRILTPQIPQGNLLEPMNLPH